ncbi:MAG: magnesium transporter [Ignavibacteriae bacterium]|nr:MAG: magnesium transporter [Ignavibacteriota bacterium]
MQETNEIKNTRNVVQIDNELIENISKLIKTGADKSVLNVLTGLHPADIAEILNHLELEYAKRIFALFPSEQASEIITELDENVREKVLKEIDVKTLTEIVDELYTDDATDIVSDLPPGIAKQVLKNIDKEDSAEVMKLLEYPEDTAGGIMTSNFVWVDYNATIKDAITEVRRNAEEFDHIYHIYVLKENEELLGIVTLKSLLTNKLQKKVKSVIQEDLMYVTPEMDQEEVAHIMNKYDLVAIPVVDEHRRMLGRITFDDIQDVIQNEASEDLQKIAGLTEEEEKSDSIITISKIRLPWLIVALLMELLAALVLRGYEDYIQQIFIATFFVPVVMAMGGSTGTQAAIVMVKSISSGEVWVSESFNNLFKEFLVAFVNGLVLGAVLFGSVTLLFPRDELSINFAIVLSVSLLLIIITATVVGASIPLILKKLNTDPAIATGPFVTTSNDILGLLIYLTIIIVYFF